MTPPLFHGRRQYNSAVFLFPKYKKADPYRISKNLQHLFQNSLRFSITGTKKAVSGGVPMKKILFPVLFPLSFRSMTITIMYGTNVNLDNGIRANQEEGAVR